MKPYNREGRFWGNTDGTRKLSYAPALMFGLMFRLPLTDPNYPVFEKAYRKAYHYATKGD